ncbi:MAG TPA: HEAT repeat domain-containing protein [Phycisphaerae bacterium]
MRRPTLTNFCSASAIIGCGAVVLLASGCAPLAQGTGIPGDLAVLRQRGFETIKRGVQYPHLASVRAQAVEAFQEAAPEDGLPWIRAALTDAHPAVRFAACLAAGTLQDKLALDGVTRCVADPDESVRVGAIFALHRYGDTHLTGQLAEYLLSASDPAVRRNAALVLGRLGEKGAVSLLARAMRDSDEGVQLQALESMSLLGRPEAQQQLTFYATSGTGYKEAFAINALGLTHEPRFADTYHYRIRHSDYLETRLAAARALGLLGAADGYTLAAEALNWNSPRRGVPDDPPENQVRRMRQLAVLALGAIGDPRGLPLLDRALTTSDDPNVQVAIGKAMLEIVNAEQRRQAPFAAK